MSTAPVPVLDFERGAPAYAGAVLAANGRMPQHVIQQATGAQALRYLQGQPPDRMQVALLKARAIELALVRSWATSCAFPRGTGDSWNAMVQTASLLTQGATPGDAAAYWKSLGSRCAKTLDGIQLVWIDLFAAVAARDRAASREKGLRILAEDTQLTKEARAYATLAAVAAARAEGRRPEAAKTLAEQRKHLLAEQVEEPWFRYLITSLAQPATEPRAPTP